MADIGSLKGSVFKKKLMSANRLKGVGSFGLAGFAWANLVPLSLMVGPTLPAVGIACTALYGIIQFNEVDNINEIKVVRDGDHAGMLELTINVSPFRSSKIYAQPRHIRSVVALGNDDIGADDTEANLIDISEYIDGNTGEVQTGLFTLPSDAYRDKPMIDYILSVTGEQESTYDDFNDLMLSRFNEKVTHGGLKGIQAFEARQTGLANVRTSTEVDHKIDVNDYHTEQNLIAMQAKYGQENLDKMSPKEFYKLYARFASN